MECRLGREDGVCDVCGVELVGEVVEGGVASQADVIRYDDRIPCRGECEDGAEVVLQVAQIGHCALPRDTGRAVGPGHERVRGGGEVCERLWRKRPQDRSGGRHAVIPLIRGNVHEPTQGRAGRNVVVRSIREGFELEHGAGLRAVVAGGGEVGGRVVERIVGDGVVHEVWSFDEDLVGADAGEDAV